MLGFNPYVMLAGGLAFVAAVSGAFFEGKHVANGEHAQQQLTALSDALADAKGKQSTINQLDAEKQRLENMRQAAVREIDHETTRIIERPVYKNVCVDADGVSLLDRAQDLASGHAGDDPGAPAGAPVGPAKGPANHRSGDRQGEHDGRRGHGQHHRPLRLHRADQEPARRTDRRHRGARCSGAAEEASQAVLGEAVMTLAQLFAKLFGPVEREAEIVAAHVVADAHSAVQLAKKELAMFDTKAISDALDRLKARPDQSATITALQGQVSDLTDKLAAADADIAELVGDLTQIQDTLLALAPDPNAAPAQ